MNFKAWMIFVPVWSTIVYSVGAFSLWGGGWLAQLGAADYSGGYVIHLAAGISGFVTAAMVGPRLLADRKDFEPNNLIIALAGAGILWLGWNGFNGGDPYFANHDAAAAVLNTNITTAVSLLVWLILDMFATGKVNAVSMINGMIVGLVAITPAAGFVNGYRRDDHRLGRRRHRLVQPQQAQQHRAPADASTIRSASCTRTASPVSSAA